MAFTSVAALIGGTVDAVTVMGAIAEVGTAMSVVGAVTGNSDLTKFGAVAGLVGGVGSLAAGASGAADATFNAAADSQAANASLDFNAAADSQSANLADVAGNSTSPDAAFSQPVTQSSVQPQSLTQQAAVPQAPAIPQTPAVPANPLPAPVTAQSPSSTFGPMGEGQTITPVTDSTSTAANSPSTGQGTVSSTPTGNTTTDGSAVSGAPNAPAATQTVSPAVPTGSTANSNISGANTGAVSGDVNPLDKRMAAGTATTPGAGSSAPASSFWSSLSRFASTHDKLLSMAMQVGGGALSGMQKASQFDQQMALANQKQQWGNSVPSLAPRSLIQSAKVSA